MTEEHDHDDSPFETSERGTAVLALLFIGALAGMWAVIYFVMLERGG